ncbi:hypothetical protein [Micromonospora sonchi]|uniref:hypothetical protein n=1 Tax=Micromonospora sonchi TaxID=1763543 RepID=UPI0016651E6B|nr:hypothetical protein [Micromonospora sonchi]
MQTLTLKAGSLGRPWHAAHILLSILTVGWWLPIYGVHVLVSVISRPTVQLEVPSGHRVEYRDGWPNVLGPEEYLEPRSIRERAAIIAGYLSPVLIITAIVIGLTIRAN